MRQEQQATNRRGVWNDYSVAPKRIQAALPTSIKKKARFPEHTHSANSANREVKSTPDIPEDMYDRGVNHLHRMSLYLYKVAARPKE